MTAPATRPTVLTPTFMQVGLPNANFPTDQQAAVSDPSAAGRVSSPPAGDLQYVPDQSGAVVRQAARFADRAVAEPALDKALSLIDEAAIKADLFHIASDAMQGRDTPSEGLTKTALYISDRLFRCGWLPGGPEGSYLYPYQLRGFSLDIKRSTITLNLPGGRETLVYGKDYFYSSIGHIETAPVVGDVVFAGHGTEGEFKAIDVKGKWVVCLDSQVNPVTRRKNAKQQGALGVIVVPDPAEPKKNYERKLKTYLDLAQKGRMQYPSQPAEIDEIILSAESGEKIIKQLHQQPPANGAAQAFGLVEKRKLIDGVRLSRADNVIGLIKGSDPKKSKEVIVLTAHYDHIGVGWSGAINNGADDNASGSAALLSLVDAIMALNPERSIMLMWVSGEEKGLLGSKAWVNNPSLPEEGMRVVANINLDMVSRNAGELIYYTPTPQHERHNDVARAFEEQAALEGFSQIKSADRYFYYSDQAAFADAGIPVVFLTTGTHKDYHTERDDPDKSDTQKLARCARLALRVLHMIDRRAESPRFG
ncbi:MAG: M28 family peptidase [Deltaproteobacteria bacterium]|nr:M28 family peptidase [Deltaproteobacteria bacterium]